MNKYKNEKKNDNEDDLDFDMLDFVPEINVEEEILVIQKQLKESENTDNTYSAIDYVINCEQEDAGYQLDQNSRSKSRSPRPRKKKKKKIRRNLEDFQL